MVAQRCNYRRIGVDSAFQLMQLAQMSPGVLFEDQVRNPGLPKKFLSWGYLETMASSVIYDLYLFI